MTDKDVIKALDDRMYCGKWIGKGFLDKKDFQILKNALNLINQQQAEIDRLRKEVKLVSIQFQDLQERYEEAQTEIAQWKEEANRYQRLWCIAIDDIETAKSKAIQEFAEKLKKEFLTLEYQANTTRKTLPIDFVKDQIKWLLQEVSIDIIDSLVKKYEKGRYEK